MKGLSRNAAIGIVVLLVLLGVAAAYYMGYLTF